MPLKTKETGAGSSSHAQNLQKGEQNHNVQHQNSMIEPMNIPEQSSSTLPPFPHDPYLGLPVIGNGLTGVVLKMGEGRALKKARRY